MANKRPTVVLITPQRKKLKLSQYLPFRLSVTSNAVSQLIARAYEERFGLTIPQWRLLAVLGDEGPMTPQKLCGYTLMDKVTVMRAGQGLLNRKLVNRLPNPRDGRSHCLEMTPAGERLYAEVAPLALRYEETLLQGFDTAEVQKFEEWLLRLMDRAVALTHHQR